MRFALDEVRPDEHHCGARGRRQQNQPGHVGIDLPGRQKRPEQVGYENPPEQRHREWLDEPVDPNRRHDPTPVVAHLAECRQVDLEQHRHDHQPHQHGNRQIDFRHGCCAKRVEHIRQDLPQRNPDDDTKRNPKGQIALENSHRGGFGCRDRYGFTHVTDLHRAKFRVRTRMDGTVSRHKVSQRSDG